MDLVGQEDLEAQVAQVGLVDLVDQEALEDLVV
jgi:hypothetical protein